MKTSFDGFLFNPLLYYGAGLVPAILICTSLKTGLIYGLMLLISLCLSDLIVYLLKPLIRRDVRIPCIIMCAFSSVYIIDFFVYLIVPNSYNSLSSLIAMLVVSTVLLYKIDEGAYKSTSIKSTMWDAFLNGLSYLLAVALIGLIRELIAHGTIWETNIGIDGISASFDSMIGGLFVTTIIAFIYNLVTIPLRRKKRVFDSLVAKYSYYIQKTLAESLEEEKAEKNVATDSSPEKEEV